MKFITQLTIQIFIAVLVLGISVSPRLLSAQPIQCCDFACGDGLSSLLVCGDYDLAPGPFYVKVYLRFIDPQVSGAFDDPFPARADEIWQILNTAFKPHNIFFVPGFGSCGQQTYTVINSSIKATENSDFTALREGTFNGVPNFVPDGINLYVFRDDQDLDTPGNSFCVPNSYCYLGGTSPCCPDLPVSKSAILPHEIAHCLGLLHTDEFNLGDVCEDIDGTHCKEKGDLVCGTPPDSGVYGSPTSCSPIPLFKNFMSLFPIITCKDHFVGGPGGQGERMRHYIKNGIGTVAQVRIQDIIISGYTTWNVPRIVSANVIIEPGGILNIEAAVTMQENAYIYIKANHAPNSSTPSGGQLRVDALITTACSNKFWQGVIVDGDENFPQSSQRQGKLVVQNDGIIEHARIGARVQWHDLDNGMLQAFATGGVVQSSFGKFRNNLIDVQFAPYNGFNTSFFNFTEFITNDDYRGSADQVPLHVSLNGVKNIRLTNGKYKDVRTVGFTIASSRGTGIDAKNSNFSVSGNSIFTNLFEGVRVGNISPSIGNSVVGATFSGCFTGIYSSNNHNYLFNGNTFNLQRPVNYTGPSNTALKAIYMEGTTAAFMVNGNQFISTDFSGTDKYFGTEVLSVTKQNNSISNNYYESLNVANRANGQNAMGNELLFSGLMYECNTYALSTEHDHLIQSGVIRKEQGGRLLQNSARLSTGNLFIDIVGQQFTNIGTPIDYHQRLNTAEAIFDGFFTPTTIIRRESLQNPNCGSGGESDCPNLPCPSTFISTIKSQFFQEKQQWLAKLAAFPGITNTTLRQTEANIINTLRLSLDHKGTTILLNYALDTTGIKADSVLVWLDHLDTYDADLQLALHQFFIGNYTIAGNRLQIIPSLYNLSGALLAEFNDIVAILQTIRPSWEVSTPIHLLPASVLGTLESDWGTDCSAAGALARNLLYQNGIRLYADCNGSEARPSAHISGSGSELTNDKLLKVYPNPASSEVTMEFPTNIFCTDLKIVGLVNARSIRYTDSNKSRIIKLDVSGLPSGLYAAIARLDNGSMIQAKFLISH